MKTILLTGAAALAMTLGAVAVQAGAPVGGPPVQTCQDDDGMEIDCPVADPSPTPTPAPTPGTGTGGTGTGTGGTGTGGSGTGTGTGSGTGTGAVTVATTATINFNQIGAALSTYTEGDYIVSLVTGSITGGFGAYGTRGLDTLGPEAATYNSASPTPQFALTRADGGFFTVDSFYNVRLIERGYNMTTLQGYINGVAGGSSSVTSTYDGFGYPQASGLVGAYNRVLFTLFSTSSGMSFDNLTVTAAAGPGAVPEPASWALMVLGFGLIGNALRSRRRTAVRFA